MSMIGLQACEAEDLASMGRWDEALALGQRIVEPLADADQILDLATLRAICVGILTARGQAAGKDVQAISAWAQEREFPEGRMRQRDRRACRRSGVRPLGERDEALRLLIRVAAVRESISSCPQFGLTLPAQLRMAAALDDLDLARRFAAKTIAARPLDSHALVLLSALEAEHEGRLDEAARQFAEAASRWHAFGVPWEEAQALLGQGRCLVALGRDDDASRPLRRAARVFKRLGAGPALSQTLRLLGSRERAPTQGARG